MGLDIGYVGTMMYGTGYRLCGVSCFVNIEIRKRKKEISVTVYIGLRTYDTDRKINEASG